MTRLTAAVEEHSDGLGVGMRSKVAAALAPLLSHGFSAVANTAAVFALSASAGVNFPRFAASTAALILAYGTARSVLGEPLMLTQRDLQTGSESAFPSLAGWTAASIGVGILLASLAAGGLRIAGVLGVSAITFAAVLALIFNDACRHLCFARGSSWTAAVGDVALAAVTLGVWIAAARLGPNQVYGIWLLTAALIGVMMIVRTRGTAVAGLGTTADVPVLEWMVTGWSRTKWLAAEAIAVTAAVTLPLILAADRVAGPGRLLLSWFGFQQILFFAAYAVATRSDMNASRTAGTLFGAGAAGSVIVGGAVALAPTDFLVQLFGPVAETAQGWALWFAAAQIANAAGNAAALAARLISAQHTATATKLFRVRLVFAILATVAGIVGARAVGVGGYIAGFALGATLHVGLSLIVLRRSSAADKKS